MRDFTTAALIVAAGRGQRMGTGAGPKQYRRVAGRQVLTRTVEAFARHDQIDTILVVIHADDDDLYAQAIAESCIVDVEPKRDGCHKGKLYAPAIGGPTRQASVLHGLRSLAEQAFPPDIVLIHDAARPFVTSGDISQLIAAATDTGAAIAAIEVVDTLKRAELVAASGDVVASPQQPPPPQLGPQLAPQLPLNSPSHLLPPSPAPSPAPVIAETVPRDRLWRALTPQAFAFAPILAAHVAAAQRGGQHTDDAAVAEAAGLKVRLVATDPGNVKLTRPEDLIAAEQRLMSDQQTQANTIAHAATSWPDVRTGTGFDVHRFGPGQSVWLCGVEIPFTQTLEGHSDADVGLHALTDAILGAIGDGDIGAHFPPSDPQWKGAASDQFLADAVRRVRERNGQISNVDVTLLCEAPKVGPHRPAMRERIAAILNIDVDRVGVKATTTEKLGFTGRGEGIAAMASATVILPPTS